MQVEAAFEELSSFLHRFNAIDFLSQFSMTHLFAPEDQFVSESDELHVLSRNLEFASGFYAAHPLRTDGEPVDGFKLEEFNRLIGVYFNAVNTKLLTGAVDGSSGHQSSPLASAKIHSMHVRGDAYPHQFWYLTEAVYSPHDQWFLANLGFTIQDAINIAKSVESTLNDRYEQSKCASKEAAKELVTERESEWKAADMTEEQALISAGVQLFFGQSTMLYRLSIGEVAEMSGTAEHICLAFLSRLSQEPPYRNPLFPDTYTDPLQALWDYNTSKERPFFTDGESFWIFSPHSLKEVLYSTFFFDLMADRSYRAAFEASRGKVLEELSARFLKRIFPPQSVYVNPTYLNGEEFADVCVIYDSKVLIVQCKSKGLTLHAHRGDDEGALKNDLQKAIRDAVAQGCKGKTFLESTDQPSLLYDGKKIAIDMSQINEILLVAVTYMPLHSFATRIREVEDDLGLAHSEFPAWALPVGDLDLVTQICYSPAKLLHYIRRRLLLEVGEKRIRGDEMDLLAFYLDQGLWLKGGDMDEANLIGLSGYSGTIDEYVFDRYTRDVSVPLPKISRPEGFDELIADIESLSQPHRTDCALVLMEASGETSAAIMGVIERTKERCRERRDTIPSSVGNDEPPWGMSIVATPASMAAEESFNRAQGFGNLKKYVKRLEKWVALGWRQDTERSIDFAIWLDYPFEQDPEMDKLATTVFGPQR